jgi:hypothetical protein
MEMCGERRGIALLTEGSIFWQKKIAFDLFSQTLICNFLTIASLEKGHL